SADLPRATAQEVTARMSVKSNGVEGDARSIVPSISADGRYVAFQSEATNLVTGDTDGVSDIFVHDRITGTTVRVSISSTGVQGNGYSSLASISSDGRFVAFQSEASNLVSNDFNGAEDVFVHDRDSDGNGIFDEGDGITICASVDSTGASGDTRSYDASMAGDGTLVAFTSDATNLISRDRNDTSDIFVRELTTGTTYRVSVDS